MFSPQVEYWRPYFTGVDLPTDFVLDWIEKESGGNPCNIEHCRTASCTDEVGILQLMVPNDTSLANTDEATLRAACVGLTNQTARDLTSDDIDAQVQSSIDYIQAQRARAHELLAQVGSNWDESTPDFWALVRLLHAAPALTQYLQTAANALGRGPTSWNEFTQYAPVNHWLDVSAENGTWAAGFQPSILGNVGWFVIGAAIAGVVLGAWLYSRRSLLHLHPA